MSPRADLPLPLDPATTASAVAAGVAAAGGSLGPEGAAAILRGDCRLSSATPLADAAGIAAAWTWMASHRMDHPRAGVRIVVADPGAASALRERGFDAATAFSHGRGADALRGIGLLLLAGLGLAPREDLARLLDVPAGVRIALLDHPGDLRR